MKILAALALVLGLGLGLFLVLSDEDGRGGGRGGRTPSTADTPRVEATREAEEPGPESAPQASSRTTRQVAPEGPSVEARMRCEGSVIGEGAPVPGAEVEVWRHEQRLAEAKSDARGRFKLEYPPQNAPTLLRIRARGFVSLERTLGPKPRAGTEMLGNVRLLRGQRLAGRVVDSRGTPVEGATVRAEPGAPGTDVHFTVGTSLHDGSFELADCPPGLVQVSVRARGYGEARVTHTPGRPLEVRLLPGVDLPLVLIDPSGFGIAGVEVTIQSIGTPEQLQRSLTSDADGRALFEGLNARLWNVRTAHPDYRPAPGSKVTASGNEERLTLKPWPAITGTVRTPGGEPPPAGTRVNALIALAPGDTLGDMPGGTEVAADGTFRIRGLRPADWVVRVSAPGFAPTVSTPVKLLGERDGEVGTIVLQSGGRLVLEITCGSQKVSGAEGERLAMAPTPAQLWAIREARTEPGKSRPASDASGKLQFENLAAGSLWIAIYAEGYAPALTGPHLPSETSSLPIPVELVRGARVQGVVRKKSGAPEAGAQLRVVAAGGELGFPMMLATDEQGRYTTAWLPPGRYSLEAFSSDDPALRSGARELELLPGTQPEVDLTL
jgi:protocatechuate 3,4-dioxygenase beta subunit